MTAMTVSIYALFDPREPDHVRYVGKTEKSLSSRRSQHLRETRRGLKAHRYHWIASLLAQNVVPGIRLVAQVLSSEWQSQERSWIQCYRDAGHHLTNGTTGGEGLDSASWRAIWSDPDMRERQSAALKAYCASEEVRHKKSMDGKRRFSDPLERQRAKERLHAAFSRDPDARERMRVATAGSWRDPIVRRRRIDGIRSSALTRKSPAPFTQEHLSALGESAKRRWNDSEFRNRVISGMRRAHRLPGASQRSSDAKRRGWVTRRANIARTQTCV